MPWAIAVVVTTAAIGIWLIAAALESYLIGLGACRCSPAGWPWRCPVAADDAKGSFNRSPVLCCGVPEINFPSMPDPHAIAVMLLTLVALALFTRDKIPLETSAMIVSAALAIGFELFPYEVHGKTLQASEFFHGFGHEALVAVCALMIVGHALVRTGAIEPLGAILARLWRARRGAAGTRSYAPGADRSRWLRPARGVHARCRSW